MVKTISITKFNSKITSKERKKIVSLAKSITSDTESITLRESEFPQKGISEINFDTELKNNKDIIIFLFMFLSFLQNDKFEVPFGEWYTFRCGNYTININEEAGRSDPIIF